MRMANASYAVASSARREQREETVKDSPCRPPGLRGLRFNAVVATNEAAIHLYEDLGFTWAPRSRQVRSILGNFEDMHIYCKDCFGAALPS